MTISPFWGRAAGGYYSTLKDKIGNAAGFIVKGKRSHATMKGTRVDKIANVGTAGGHGSGRQTDLSKLAANAMALGWLNGKRIRKEATR